MKASLRHKSFCFEQLLRIEDCIVWLLVSLQVRDKMEKTKLQIMAERAINGDEEALAYLDLEEKNIVGKKPAVLTWHKLCADYNYVAHVYVVASKLNLLTLQRTLHLSLQHMHFIVRNQFQKEFPVVATATTIETLAETLSMTLLDVPPPHLNRREDCGNDTSSSSSSDGEPDPKKKQRNSRKKF